LLTWRQSSGPPQADFAASASTLRNHGMLQHHAKAEHHHSAMMMSLRLRL
jgi:hypothetical protein